MLTVLLLVFLITGAAANTDCPAVYSAGPCVANSCPVGYSCNSAGNCCQTGYGTGDRTYQIGPATGGLCPNGHTLVYSLPPNMNFPNGVCVDNNGR